MQNANIIEVDNISKIFSKNYKSARHQLKKILIENYFGCQETSELNKDEFWALRNVI